MSANSLPAILNLPPLSSVSVRDCVEKTHDLVFLISADDQIAGVFQTSVFEACDIHFWIGQPLHRVVSADSQAKLPWLLEHDAAQQDPQAIWRHINLLDWRGEQIPVRALYMTLHSEHDILRCLFCRDLRSAQEMHNRYMVLQQGLQQENDRLRAGMATTLGTSPWFAFQVDPIVRSIKRSSYQKAIDETVQNLERACMRALLIEVAGDHRRAAELAGFELTDWLTKATHLRVI